MLAVMSGVASRAERSAWPCCRDAVIASGQPASGAAAQRSTVTPARRSHSPASALQGYNTGNVDSKICLVDFKHFVMAVVLIQRQANWALHRSPSTARNDSIQGLHYSMDANECQTFLLKAYEIA